MSRDHSKIARMADENRNTRPRLLLPVRPATRGEVLWEFVRDIDQQCIRCELHDCGYGLDVQILEGDVPIYNRLFTRSMDPTGSPRQLAVRWANEERYLLRTAATASIPRP
jgi:hypothetical protein